MSTMTVTPAVTSAVDKLSTNDLAEMLDVSSRQVRQMRVQGTGPAYVSTGPRTFRYDRATVAAWINEKTHDRLPALREIHRVPPHSSATPIQALESAVARVVATAPPLTPDQRERLAVILGGVS